MRDVVAPKVFRQIISNHMYLMRYVSALSRQCLAKESSSGIQTKETKEHPVSLLECM